MGIVGLLLYMAPFFYICIVVFKRRSFLKNNIYCCAALCCLIGFWMVTWFNPWMNAVLGIAMYALNCSVVDILKLEK